MSTNIAIGLLLVSLHGLAGCTVIAVADAAASTAIGAGKLAVKGTGAAVGAVIPDGDDEEEKQ